MNQDLSWRRTRLLGRGSFGAVYEIERSIAGVTEKAALKVLSIPRDESDVQQLRAMGYTEQEITAYFQRSLASFMREYGMMARLRGHSNIVYCDDLQYSPRAGGTGWELYIRMELLTPLLQAPPQEPQAQALRLGKDMARALTLCEQLDIIHRDIKPQNIFLARDGNYKLGDFGVAKIAERTEQGTRIGTLRYIAPEIFYARPYGHTADIYSLGLVLYWLLNDRRLPFEPAQSGVPLPEEAERAMTRRLAGETMPPPAHGSPALQSVVLRACAHDPAQRYQRAAELLGALEQAERAPAEETIPTAPKAGSIPAQPLRIDRRPPEDTYADPAPPAPEAKPKKRTRWLWIAAAAVIALGLGLAVFLTQNRDAEQAEAAVTDVEEVTPEAEFHDHVMVWNDDVLEARMRSITGIESGDIMLSEVWDYTTLYLGVYSTSSSNARIHNLSALSELENLTTLVLNSNNISDISPLAELTNLTELRLSHNNISDISPLAELTNLTELWLFDNNISDVSPLAGLTNLEVLYLGDNNNITAEQIAQLASALPDCDIRISA